MKLLKFLKRTAGGFSVTESVISLGIGAVAIVGGMTLSQHELRMVKSVRESNAASHALDERIEQLRLANWRQMTDLEFLKTDYFPKKPKSAHALPGVLERITVTAYPDATACEPLTIETDAYGTPHVLSSGAGLDKQRLARVNVRVNWLGIEEKERVRELASIISNAGINATSLPVMGADGDTSVPAATETSTTTSSGTTGTTTTTTSTQTSVRGRGNVAGKTGTK